MPEETAVEQQDVEDKAGQVLRKAKVANAILVTSVITQAVWFWHNFSGSTTADYSEAAESLDSFSVIFPQLLFWINLLLLVPCFVINASAKKHHKTLVSGDNRGAWVILLSAVPYLVLTYYLLLCGFILLVGIALGSL